MKDIPSILIVVALIGYAAGLLTGILLGAAGALVLAYRRRKRRQWRKLYELEQREQQDCEQFARNLDTWLEEDHSTSDHKENQGEG